MPINKSIEENYRTYKRKDDAPVNETMAKLEAAKQSISGRISNEGTIETVRRTEREAENEKKREANRKHPEDVNSHKWKGMSE